MRINTPPFVVTTLAATLSVACADKKLAEPEGPVTLVPGKSDETIETPEIVFDEADDDWSLVTECVGYGLCLDVLVAGRDRSNFEVEGLSYPMQRVIDELFFASDLQISPNCDGRLGFDSDDNVGCAPEDGDAFIFAEVVDRRDGSDSTWQWITYDYDTPERARLFHHAPSDSYYLDLR